jgi:O-antigen/teichoic acid export membrane protein
VPAAPAFVRGLAPVTAGVLAAGLLTFGFLSLAGRVLGPEGLAPVSSLWAMVFIVGPGVFLPLQQEIARVLGGQRAENGGATAVRRAAALATALFLVLATASVAAGPWLVPAFFDGRWPMMGCFVGAVAAYAVAYTARGVLSGVGAFPALGAMIALESLVRLVLAAVLTLAGLRSATWFGVSLALAPLLSTGATWLWGRRDLRLLPGAPVSWRSLTRAFGWLVLAAVLMQLLANAGPLAVQVLETDEQTGRAGLYLGALMIARVSLYLFQAVQATILPNLAELAAAGRVGEIRAALRRIVVVALGLVVVTFVAGLLLGPFGVRLLFGDRFTIGHWTMAVLASASAVYVLAAALNGAALSIGGHRLSAAAWAAGCVVLVAGFAVPGDLFARVNTAYALGSCAAAGVFLLRLPRLLEAVPVGAQSWSGSSAS